MLAGATPDKTGQHAWKRRVLGSVGMGCIGRGCWHGRGPCATLLIWLKAGWMLRQDLVGAHVQYWEGRCANEEGVDSTKH